jgi:lipid A disaccharide synthetase
MERGRVEIIKKYVDEMMVILPFEEDFYKTWGTFAFCRSSVVGCDFNAAKY